MMITSDSGRLVISRLPPFTFRYRFSPYCCTPVYARFYSIRFTVRGCHLQLILVETFIWFSFSVSMALRNCASAAERLCTTDLLPAAVNKAEWLG